MSDSKVLISGGTGFVGAALVDALPNVAVFSRDPVRARASLERRLDREVSCFAWAGGRTRPPQEAFEGVETVVHLAGKSVDTRWSESAKREIRDSRVESTRSLVETLGELNHRPKALICASAVGYYGSRGDEWLDESSEAGEGFLAEVCQEWETEAAKAEAYGIRVVSLRIGVVLGPEGGALARMLPIFRFGLGGSLAGGGMWMPWIHREDLVRLFIAAADREEWSGPVNGVAPEPVQNREFTKTLGKVLGRPTVLPVPKFALKVGMGEFSTAILASARVRPAVATGTGFEFRHPQLEGALRDILQK